MARLKKLKAETPPQKVILEYLEKNVSESLAERINSGDKTLQGCWNILFQTPVLNADFLASTRFKYSGYSWQSGATKHEMQGNFR